MAYKPKKNEYKRYTFSQKLWEQWRKRHRQSLGTCYWEIFYADFKLEFWDIGVDKTRPTIIQLFPDGNGFQDYVQPTKLEEAAGQMWNELALLREEYEKTPPTDPIEIARWKRITELLNNAVEV